MSEQSWFDLMRHGAFARAWELSDRDLCTARATQTEQVPRHLQRIWDGSPLSDRRVLVRCYHGLGDTLQFVRFVPRLAEIATSVALWVQSPLMELLEGTWPDVRLEPLHDGSPSTPFDVDVELMELPHVFRITEESIPARVPYLRMAHRAAREQGAARTRPRVGLVWRGGGWDARRSIPFEQLAHLFARTDIEPLPLQDALTADEARCLPRWQRIAPPCRLAEAIADLDLVITVDTMAAHLAGALAAPTWLLLHSDADWRWMIDRDDTPWYPTMRLFRRAAGEDWRRTTARVTHELDRFIEHWRQRSDPSRRRAPLASVREAEPRC
jgi:hypothetical protein